MNALDLRFCGPVESFPGMHEPSKHPVQPWVGLFRAPGPSLGRVPPPLPPGPPPSSQPPPLQQPLPPHHLQYCFPNSPVEYQVHNPPPPPPPLLHLQAHPPRAHQPLPPQITIFRPQIPVLHHHHHPPPPLQSHPPTVHFHHPPIAPMASKLPAMQHQFPSAAPGINPPLPSTPYPYLSVAQAIPPTPAPAQRRALEPQPPGLDINRPSLQRQIVLTVKPEPETSSLSVTPPPSLPHRCFNGLQRQQIVVKTEPQTSSLWQSSPHRCFTEVPKFERPQAAEENKEVKKEKSSINFPSTFTCDVLDDSDDEQDNAPSTYLFHPGAIDFTYRPPPPRDPFANSKSLRHQQPANPRRRRDDDYVAENDEDDTDLEDENDDDFIVREEKAYQEIFPKVRKLMTEMGVDDNWQSDKEDKACMICPFPQRLKGWTALLQHAEKFKRRRPVQHRAYYRALSEHLKRGPPRVDDESSEEKAVLIDTSNLAEETIVWPPLVIVTNLKDDESLDIYVPNISNMDVDKTLRENVNGKAGRLLVTFPATEIGLLNAKLLVECLAKFTSSHKHNQAGYNSRVAMGKSSGHYPRVITEIYPLSWPIDYHPQLPTGHLAEPADMNSVDPHKQLIIWSAENKRDILKRLSKISKEEHEREKAKVKAKLVEVDQIAESHQKFKSSKALLSQQLNSAQIALQEQKRLEEYISFKHAEELRVMDAQFKDDMWRFEEERVDREGKIRALLDWNEKQLMKERFDRSKEVEVMKFQFASITQELERQKAQKVLENEREIGRRREKIFALMKQRECQFNEEARDMERNLLEKHEAQKIKLVEDFHKMRQDILMEWLEKQAALKASAETAKQEKEILEREAKKFSTDMIKECSVCFMEFDEETKRALIQPCGHAKVCIECAVDIYHRTKLCPICREKISSKPKIMPKLFM